MTVTPVAAAYNSPVNFYISQSPPTGISDPKAEEAFKEVYNAFQNVIQSLINNCGIGPQSVTNWSALAGSPQTLLSGNLSRLYVTAFENIPFGAVVSLNNNAGVLNARLANATDNTKPADGFCTTTSGIPIGTVGEIQLHNGIINLAGLVIGTRYFLSTVNGLITTVRPVAAGNIEQYIGIAIDTISLWANIGYWVQH